MSGENEAPSGGGNDSRSELERERVELLRQLDDPKERAAILQPLAGTLGYLVWGRKVKSTDLLSFAVEQEPVASPEGYAPFRGWINKLLRHGILPAGVTVGDAIKMLRGEIGRSSKETGSGGGEESE